MQQSIKAKHFLQVVLIKAMMIFKNMHYVCLILRKESYKQAKCINLK